MRPNAERSAHSPSVPIFTGFSEERSMPESFPGLASWPYWLAKVEEGMGGPSSSWDSMKDASAFMYAQA